MRTLFSTLSPTTSEQELVVSKDYSTTEAYFSKAYPSVILINNTSSEPLYVKLISDEEADLIAKYPTDYQFIRVEQGTYELSDLKRIDKIVYKVLSLTADPTYISALDYINIR